MVDTTHVCELFIGSWTRASLFRSEEAAASPASMLAMPMEVVLFSTASMASSLWII